MVSSIAIVTSANARHASSAEVTSAEGACVTSAEAAHVTSAEAASAKAAATPMATAATATASASASASACLCSTRRQQRPGKQGACQYHRRSSSSHVIFPSTGAASEHRTSRPVASYGPAARNR
jgi:hypothetical protein